MEASQTLRRGIWHRSAPLLANRVCAGGRLSHMLGRASVLSSSIAMQTLSSLSKTHV